MGVMDIASVFMWKYCSIIANVMEPESIFFLLIDRNYSVFKSKSIFELQRSED